MKVRDLMVVLMDLSKTTPAFGDFDIWVYCQGDRETGINEFDAPAFKAYTPGNDTGIWAYTPGNDTGIFVIEGDLT